MSTFVHCLYKSAYIIVYILWFTAIQSIYDQMKQLFTSVVRALTATLIVVASGWCVVGCSNDSSERIPTYEVVTVDFEDFITIEGETQPANPILVNCPSDVDGKIASFVESGTMVKEGEVVESGTHEELLERDGLYAKLITMQHLEK